MVNRIRASDPCGLNEGPGSNFCVGPCFQQETPEEGQRIYQPKRCGSNNKDEDNSQKTLNDKNQNLLNHVILASYHFVRQIKYLAFLSTWLSLCVAETK